MKDEDDLDRYQGFDDDMDDVPELAISATEGDPAWLARADPPILPRGTDRAVVPGAMDDLEEEDEPDEVPSDDMIAARVRRLLRSDSATSMLRIQVSVEDGVVTLQGLVQTLEDTDNAAEVASRVAGVIDVVDELDVED
jgi:hypothetical protein